MDENCLTGRRRDGRDWTGVVLDRRSGNTVFEAPWDGS